MDHFHEVTGAVGTNMGDTWFPLGNRGNGTQDWPQGFPCVRASTRHDRRPGECALLAAGNSSANEVDSRFTNRFFAANRVGEKSVTTVNDDVTGFENLNQLVNNCVGSRPRLHHDDCGARFREGCCEIFKGFSGNEIGLGVGGNQRLGFIPRAVVDRYPVAFTACQVSGKV